MAAVTSIKELAQRVVIVLISCFLLFSKGLEQQFKVLCAVYGESCLIFCIFLPISISKGQRFDLDSNTRESVWVN